MTEEERKQIGWCEREEGFYKIYAPVRGAIVTQAFILCRYCGDTIYHCMGPKYDAVCFSCYDNHEFREKVETVREEPPINNLVYSIFKDTEITTGSLKGSDVIKDGCFVASPEGLQKFAELVVEECISYVKYRTEDWDAKLVWKFNDGSGTMDVNIDELLKEHFSIKK